VFAAILTDVLESAILPKGECNEDIDRVQGMIRDDNINIVD
jgi:hypothetical protein